VTPRPARRGRVRWTAGANRTCRGGARTCSVPGAGDGSCSATDSEVAGVVPIATVDGTSFVIAEEGCTVPAAARAASCAVIAADGDGSCSVHARSRVAAAGARVHLRTRRSAYLRTAFTILFS
jgi:hypothetical protein